MKDISVIVPIYNAENWLPRLLESINNQTIFDEIEVVLVNDGSEDASLRLIEEFSKNKKNVRVINQKNSGVSAARNNGITNATGKYIAFIDADDYIDNDYFESYMNSVKENYDLIVGGYIVEYSSGYRLKKAYNDKSLNNKDEIMKKFLNGTLDPNCWNKLYKKDIITKIKFDEKMRYGEDRELLFNYLRYSNNIRFIDKAKYHYTINCDSVMRKQFNRKSFDIFEKIEKRRLIIKSEYPNLIDYYDSSTIDGECRVLCSLVEFKLKKDMKEMYKKLKRDINSYSIIKKKKYSTKKHFLAFIAVKVNPRIYVFVKKHMKLQYK